MSQHRPNPLATHPSPPFRPNSPPSPTTFHASHSSPFSNSSATSFSPASTASPPSSPLTATPHFTTIPEHGASPTEPISSTGNPLASRLHRRLSSIRTAMAREQLLFGGARVAPGAAAARVEGLRLRDEEDAARARAQGRWGDDRGDGEESGVGGPSAEASAAERVGENGMGEGREYGWPGLGVFAEEGRKTGAQRAEEMRQRQREGEAAWGWPGLGWVEYRPGK